MTNVSASSEMRTEILKTAVLSPMALHSIKDDASRLQRELGTCISSAGVLSKMRNGKKRALLCFEFQVLNHYFLAVHEVT
jgi:hypothetical protein